jgi:hypothetical protein
LPRLLAALLAVVVVCAQLAWSIHAAEAPMQAHGDCTLCDLAGGHSPVLPAALAFPTPQGVHVPVSPPLPQALGTCGLHGALARAPPDSAG